MGEKKKRSEKQAMNESEPKSQEGKKVKKTLEKINPEEEVPAVKETVEQTEETIAVSTEAAESPVEAVKEAVEEVVEEVVKETKEAEEVMTSDVSPVSEKNNN